MSNSVKKWGIACGMSIVVILAPLWATLIAVLLGTTLPRFIDFITSIDKFISIFGVIFFIISIYQFSKLIAKPHENKEENQDENAICD